MGQVSTFCNGADTCIKVDRRGDLIYLRNVANTSVAVVATPAEFHAFLAGAKAGEFDAFTQGSEKDPEMGVLPSPIKARV